MANAIIYGTFDLFHVRYLRLLQRARSVCEKSFFTMGSDPIVLLKLPMGMTRPSCVQTHLPLRPYLTPTIVQLRGMPK